MSGGEGYQVVMPKLGLIMTEARLVEWYKREGERVEIGEPLFALESEKSTLDIEAPAGGYVNILVQAGETVPVMTPIARILGEDAPSPGASIEPVSVPSRDVHMEEIPARSMGVIDRPVNIRATPKARKLARLRGVNLAHVRGSGPRQMVVVADLDQPTESSPANATPIAIRMAADYGLDLSDVTGTGPGGRISRADVSGKLAAIVARSAAPPVDQQLSLPGLRGVIARRLTESWRERPQVTLTTEIDATDLINARQQLVAESGQKISYNAFFVLASAQVLEEQPHVNVRLTADGLVRLPEINIGVAVDTERGLLVPVVRNANSKSVTVLDAELNELAQRALSGQSLPDELTGGSITVTNLGKFGIDVFTPIINPPEIAVLGIGRIAARPFAVGRKLEVRDTVVLSLSFDHRLIDGAPAARFLQRIAELIELPSGLTGIDYGTE
ncbi:MAG: dihydrolipoamide acetyltransferase family protein [Candidatus Promineifilaceae bacterium]